MGYLLTQILLFLILASVIGFFVGWVTRGFGFESRLISSENQWRAKHHVLQGENHRLQSELKYSKDELQRVTKEVPVKRNTDSLPLMSTTIGTALRSGESDVTVPPAPKSRLEQTLESTAKEKTDVLAKSHPLERLRSKLSQIEDEEEQANSIGRPPAPIEKPTGDVDDLQKISGIGPKIESTLHDLGIFHFKQIAEFDQDNIKWISEHLNFKGRIEREKWVEQAKQIITKDV
ncbi:hypothetical protein QYM36_019656 [Artemia franciscana]|uniref:Uncharacterized protein n=1 Tax=Artemia franciscana TaxID=6661 RepID=A0AA88H7J6_ARTSF|nr:hypothetical protein QYM36_019656 [Artemia franciscana]